MFSTLLTLSFLPSLPHPPPLWLPLPIPSHSFSLQTPLSAYNLSLTQNRCSSVPHFPSLSLPARPSLRTIRLIFTNLSVLTTDFFVPDLFTHLPRRWLSSRLICSYLCSVCRSFYFSLKRSICDVMVSRGRVLRRGPLTCLVMNKQMLTEISAVCLLFDVAVLELLCCFMLTLFNFTFFPPPLLLILHSFSFFSVALLRRDFGPGWTSRHVLYNHLSIFTVLLFPR